VARSQAAIVGTRFLDDIANIGQTPYMVM